VLALNLKRLKEMLDHFFLKRWVRGM